MWVPYSIRNVEVGSPLYQKDGDVHSTVLTSDVQGRIATL